ncbi:hypothetical protein OH786_14575 [Streptomyces atratus]|uniref:hypothetical protein n=1 Tax=Streptomyces atratus TaxID=1893 RepID=UPI00324B7984
MKRTRFGSWRKNQYGETDLFALAEFKPRIGENHERRYLGGSYGGVPFIDDSFARALAGRGSRMARTPKPGGHRSPSLGTYGRDQGRPPQHGDRAVQPMRELAPEGKEPEVNPSTGMWRLALAIGGPAT